PVWEAGVPAGPHPATGLARCEESKGTSHTGCYVSVRRRSLEKGSLVPSKSDQMLSTPKQGISRRRVLQTAGGVLVVAGIPASGHSTLTAQEPRAASTDLTGRVARYMASARE